MEDYNSKASKEERPTFTMEGIIKDENKFAQVAWTISAKHIYEAYRENPEGNPQKQIRDDQVRAIADSFGIATSYLNPIDIYVCMGSMIKDWNEIFVPAIELYERSEGNLQLPSLPKTKIVKTKLGDDIGVLGAVGYYLAKYA